MKAEMKQQKILQHDAVVSQEEKTLVSRIFSRKSLQPLLLLAFSNAKIKEGSVYTIRMLKCSFQSSVKYFNHPRAYIGFSV